MSKTKIAIVVLAALLVTSNLWWAYVSLDAGVTLTYLKVSLEDNEQALDQTLAALKVVAKKEYSPEQVIEAAAKAAGSQEQFEKDGFVWTGKIGLRFDESGRLVEVKRGWK